MASTTPTVTLLIEGSAVAYTDNGEIVETVEFDDQGQPLWEHAIVADHRGVGGQAGYDQLVTALTAAESNARMFVDTLTRVKEES